MSAILTVMLQDEDDLELSTADARRFSSEASDRGKRKKLEQELKGKGKEVAAQPLHAEKSKLKLKALRERMTAGQKDEETKRLQQGNPVDRQQTFGTKTRRQEEEERLLDADVAATADRLVDESKTAEQITSEQRKEGEVQTEQD